MRSRAGLGPGVEGPGLLWSTSVHGTRGTTCSVSTQKSLAAGQLPGVGRKREDPLAAEEANTADSVITPRFR